MFFEQHVFTPTQGMPVHSQSQDAKLPKAPMMEWDDGTKIPIAVIDSRILWESMFVLPNRESRMALLMEGPLTWIEAWHMPSTRFVRPIDERVSYTLREKGEPMAWTVPEVTDWCWRWAMEVNHVIDWAERRGLMIHDN